MKPFMFLCALLLAALLGGCDCEEKPAYVWRYNPGDIVEHVIDGRRGVVIASGRNVDWGVVGYCVRFATPSDRNVLSESASAYCIERIAEFELRPAASASVKLEAAR